MKPAPMNKDKRSPQAQEYRSLYQTEEWKILRGLQLKREPYCRFCAEEGRQVRATVADHVEPHRGQHRLFFDPGRLQSLCKPHHDGRKQSEERRGFSTQIGPDGFPVDGRHPFLKGST